MSKGKETVSVDAPALSPVKLIILLYAVVLLLGGGYFCYIAFANATATMTWNYFSLYFSNQMIWVVISALWTGAIVLFSLVLSMSGESDSQEFASYPRISLLQ